MASGAENAPVDEIDAIYAQAQEYAEAGDMEAAQAAFADAKAKDEAAQAQAALLQSIADKRDESRRAVNAMPKDEREADREDARQHKVNADYKPRMWEPDAPAMSQSKKVLQRAGQNHRDAVPMQIDAFHRICDARFNMAQARELIGDDALFQAITEGTDNEAWIPDDVNYRDLDVDYGQFPTTLYDRVNVTTVTGYKGSRPVYAHGSSFAHTAELGTPADSDPTRRKVDFEIEKYTYKVQLSDEMLDDEGFDIGGEIMAEAPLAYRNFVSSQIVAGPGTNNPDGITTTAIANFTPAETRTASNAALSLGDLNRLYYDLNARYRGSATFVTSSTIMQTITDLSQNRAQQGIAQSPEITVLGRPVETWDGTPGFAAYAAGNQIAFIGDLRAGYRWFERQGLTVEYVRTGQQAIDGEPTFVIRCRVDGKVAIANAIRRLRVAA